MESAGVQFSLNPKANGFFDSSIKTEKDLVKLKNENPTLYQNTKDMPEVFYQRAWHGSPYNFSNFNLAAIGTGLGAQVHGWGLYFAKHRGISEAYKESLSRDENRKKYLYLNGERYEATDGEKPVRADDGKLSTDKILIDAAKLIQ